MPLERSRTFRKRSVERDRARSNTSFYRVSHLSLSLQLLSMVCLLFSYPSSAGNGVSACTFALLLMSIDFLLSHNDLDDYFACPAFLLCCFFTLLCLRCCTPACIIHVILLLSLLTVVIVCYTHARSIYVSHTPFILQKSRIAGTPRLYISMR